MSIFEVIDTKAKPDIFYPYLPNSSVTTNTPLVIDNGSYQCKVGWASDQSSRLAFKNVVAKLRGKKETEVQVGNDIANIEVVRWLLKTQFDKNVVTHFDTQEQLFDYTFSHMGISTRAKVDHPILLTESVCNPNFSRQLMSELLFECYNVPRLAFGIDGLFSFNHNHPANLGQNGLVISCGYHTTHVLPVLRRKFQSQHCRRINVGGCHMTLYMHRLMQLKYPVHFGAITISRSEDWLSKHCHFAKDFKEDLLKWMDVDYYCDYVRKLQLPFNATTHTSTSAEVQKEKKLQQVKRLQEINAKRREEQLAADEDTLKQLVGIKESIEHEDECSLKEMLGNYGFDSIAECQSEIDKISSRIQRTKLKMSNVENTVNSGPKAKKACLESHILSFGSLELYLEDVKQKRQNILEARSLRKQHKADMAKRRTLASQQRMKIISQLAAERKKEDNFGANEDDWQVYKSINKESGDTDSEDEQEKLTEYEQILLEHDPEFKKEIEVEGFNVNTAEYYQLHMDTEQARVPEVLFQPSLIGFEQAGLAETIDYVLKNFTAEDQLSMTKNVFLTGGPALIPGFKTRLEKELLETRPFQSSFQVNIAGNPDSDSWNGARKWANDPSNMKYFMTKGDYEECGDGYFKRHASSNVYHTTPRTKMSTVAMPTLKDTKKVTPVIPIKRQVTPRTKQPRTVQLRQTFLSTDA